MQYRTALLGAALGQLAACFMLCGLWACDGGTSFMPRPPAVYANKQLSYFGFEPADNPRLTAAAVGVVSGLDVHVDLPFGTDLTALAPRIEHDGASIEPESGVARDFSQPVDYVVTAEDGSTAKYTVTVDVLSELTQPEPNDGGTALDANKEITRFSIAGLDADIEADNIELSVPHDTRLRGITPELEFRGASISPTALEPQDFTQPVEYVVTARDGSTRRYTVRVALAPNNSKDITHFRILGAESTITGTSIVLTLPAGTNLTTLEPTITLSGGTVMPPSGQQQDFTQPLEYTVTGADGTSKTYTVIVMLAAGSANDIMSFEVSQALTTINGDSIVLSAPYGADNCSWAPTITHGGVSIEPPNGKLQDFQAGVQYTVTAADGGKRVYTVTCQIAHTSARGITSFEVLGLPATIIGDDITLTVQNSTSLGALTPTIVHQGVRITPASGSAQNFFAPVKYKLTERNGEEHIYNVRIVNADRSDNELVDLSYAGRHAQINGQHVTLTLPPGSDVHALMPTIVHRGARTIPTGVARDFTTPQIYGVIAKDGTRRDYEVSIQAAAQSAKALEHFSLGNASAQITSTQIQLVLPPGSDPRALKPQLQHSGASIAPSPDTPQDFSQPVNYTISAWDGSKQTYTVTASVAETNANELTGFRLLGLDADIGTTQVELSVPNTTNLTALVPTFQIAGTKVQPDSSVPQNFTEPVIYTVTASNGTTRNYKITITELPQ